MMPSECLKRTSRRPDTTRTHPRHNTGTLPVDVYDFRDETSATDAVATLDPMMTRNTISGTCVVVDTMSVQDAVDAAEPGGRIVVRSGSYPLSLDVDADGLTLVAPDDPDSTTANAPDGGPTVEISASDVAVVGFEITSTSDNWTTGAGFSSWTRAVSRKSRPGGPVSSTLATPASRFDKPTGRRSEMSL